MLFAEILLRRIDTSQHISGYIDIKWYLFNIYFIDYEDVKFKADSEHKTGSESCLWYFRCQ